MGVFESADHVSEMSAVCMLQHRAALLLEIVKQVLLAFHKDPLTLH